MVVVVPLVGMGPPRTIPMGNESEWPGECHDSRSVLSKRRWSTRMGERGHGFCSVGTVRYLCRVYINLSIAVPADKGPVRSWSHYESTVIIIMCLITTPVR